MSEQRLIDANALTRCEVHTKFSGKEYAAIADVPYSQIENAPTIDPETLPIVRELREKLENERKICDDLQRELVQVAKERDAAMNDVPKNCNTCKNKSNPACEGNRRYHDFGFQENCEFWEWRGPDGDHP